MKKLVLFVLLFFCIGIALGKPKMDTWDGTAKCVKEYLTNNLDNPKTLRVFDAYALISVRKDYYQRVVYKVKDSEGKTILEDRVFFIKCTDSYDENYEVKEVWTFEEFQKFSTSDS